VLKYVLSLENYKVMHADTFCISEAWKFPASPRFHSVLEIQKEESGLTMEYKVKLTLPFRYYHRLYFYFNKGGPVSQTIWYD